jgi:16S rRNA (cytidine1402-2'-O)-methyltransferase
MKEILGDREACAAREISKKFEEFLRGPLSDLIETLEVRSIKGEFVLVIAGRTSKKRHEDTD